MFKKYLLCIAYMLIVYSMQVFGSGIQVSNTTVTTNSDKKTAQVKFSLTWDHSWRLATGDGPANWDAAWVFIKYREVPGDDWYHGFINTTASTHKIPIDAEFQIGTGSAVIGGTTNAAAGIGVFIYRKAAGNGTITFQDIELNWNFSQNGLSGGEQVEVCVLATEMVYIPAGGFSLGDQTSTNYFRRNMSHTSAAGNPFPITSEGAITLSNAYYNYTGTSGTYITYSNYIRNALATAAGAAAEGGAGTSDFPYNYNYGNTGSGYVMTDGTHYRTLAATWPKGFAAFYCMKYEITQGEYLQFLNKTLVEVKNGKFYYPGEQTTGRYGIVLKSGTGTAAVPAVYELKNSTAAYLPCGFLGTKDYLAWLVWAGLRPMSEFEYEKVNRGIEPVPATASLRPQFAWGKETSVNTDGFANKGLANEGPSNNTANCAFGTSAGVNTQMDGPMRAGGFSTPTSSRIKAGASYYGVMEMSGNMRERCVCVSIAAGRTFQGHHGNGETGKASLPQLPAYWTAAVEPTAATSTGYGFRGGSYLDLPVTGRTSDRTDIKTVDNARKANYGGRGVRSVASK